MGGQTFQTHFISPLGGVDLKLAYPTFVMWACIPLQIGGSQYGIDVCVNSATDPSTSGKHLLSISPVNPSFAGVFVQSRLHGRHCHAFMFIIITC